MYTKMITIDDLIIYREDLEELYHVVDTDNLVHKIFLDYDSARDYVLETRDLEDSSCKE